MTAPRVTCCPHCQTSFRITQAQMGAANGSVRCGSCLQVFDSRENLNESEITAEKATIQNNSFSEEQPSVQKKPVISPEITTSSTPETPDSATQLQQKYESFTAKNDEPSFSTQETSDVQEQYQTGIHNILGQIDNTEIEFSDPEFKKKHRLKTLKSSLITILLTSTLVFQFAWFQKDSLSLNLSLRPSYQMLCQALSCSLPSLVDTSAIKSLQLLVRSHPEASSALLVDTVIVNNANHPQPFPKLRLAFTDINGNLIASRIFSAREYLGGELVGSKEMPAGQPVRLGLEIIDPGQDAVNYALSFFPD